MRIGRHVIIGIAGSVALLGLYFGILTLAQSLEHAVDQFTDLWYWIVILSGGFGTQVGMYSYIRYTLQNRIKGVSTEVVATGGMSAGSMIACCAHHLVDVLPALGITAAAVFLAKYQLPFIVLGIFANLVGIITMLYIIQKKELYGRVSKLRLIERLNLKKLRTGAVATSALIVSLSFILISYGTSNASNAQGKLQAVQLEARVNEENGVSIEVKPLDFMYGKPLKFSIAINTHQGRLDFDLTRVSFLVDDNGKTYVPRMWEGSPSGGHHRNGVLYFDKLDGEPREIILIVRDVYSIPERVFRWQIPRGYPPL